MMLDLDRRKNEQSPRLSINDVIGMLEKAVIEKAQFVKDLAVRKAQQWTHELMEQCQYLGSLRKKFESHVTLGFLYCEFTKSREPLAHVHWVQ